MENEPAVDQSTATLIGRIRGGDESARERLIRRYLPALRRWARGRLPVRARGQCDTDDLVQVTLLRALDKMEGFDARRQGAFFAYLRRILQNEIRDRLRAVRRRPGGEPVTEELPDHGPSPLDSAVGSEVLRLYEAGLARLNDEQREAVVLRVELEFTYQQVAEALGSPSANAARMLISRALVRLAEVMDGR